MDKTVKFRLDFVTNGEKVMHTLEVNAEDLQKAVKGATEEVKKMRSGFDRLTQVSVMVSSINTVLSQMRGVVAGLASEFDGFDKAMRITNTMAGKSGQEFEQLKDRVTELSKTIPLAKEELANGLYQVISNGVPEDNWIEFLEQSSKSAVGGVADLGQTVTVTSTLIKNYGLEWDKAAEIQDKIQTTAKNGVTSFEQLGQALPRVSGSAAQLGVSIDELMAVFATTTGVTGTTAEVSTQLAAVLNSLVKPSTEATKAAEAMGIGFNASSVQAAGGLRNFLVGLDASIQEYAQKTGQLSQTIYGQLFGSAEAMRLLGSLTGEQKDKFAENIGAMAGSAGAIEGAFNDVAASGEAQAQILKNQTSSMFEWAGSVASAMAPYTDMITSTGIAMMSFIQLGTSVKTAAAAINFHRVAMLAAAGASKVVAAATTVWKTAQAALNVVLMWNPLGAVIAAIFGLVSILAVAYDSSESFREVCDKCWAVCKQLAAAVWDYLVKAFQKACQVIQEAWKWIKAFFGYKDTGVSQRTEDLKANTKAAQENAKANEDALKKLLQGNKKFNAPTDSKKDKKTTEADKYSGKTLYANPENLKELANNIQYYQKQLELTKTTETETIQLYARKIASLQKQQQAVEQLQAAASRPTELNTLKEIDAEISYQQSLRDTATKQNLAAINQEIQRLNGLRTAFERAAHVETGVEQIKTYKQLEAEQQYLSDVMKDATESDRAAIQRKMDKLDDLKRKWDEQLAAMKMPADISRLDTIDDLANAITYYQQRQKHAAASEVADIERTVMALEQKRDSMTRLARLPRMETEIAGFDQLDGKQLRLELKAFGIENIKKRIAELQKMLTDTKNPLDSTQRDEVNKLIGSYQQYEKVLRKNQLTVSESWGTVKGVGGGIRQMTESLEGNKDAWSTVTGVVDAALQVYEGLSGVISIIKALTGATQTETAATTAQGVAKTTQAAIDTTTTATEVANSAARTAASGVETTADVAGAAAKTMKAHASIPWVGIAIGAGMVASLVGIMAALPKFADGGIAYGPTLGLFGEYAGASSNPEVVAPLDKLRSLIQPQGGGIAEVRVTGRLRGSDIVLSGDNVRRLNRKYHNP